VIVRHRSAVFQRLVFLLAALWPVVASSNPLDISLNGLGSPATDASAVQRFRLLTTELAFALTPRATAPAETLGISGFEIWGDATIISFNTQREYWQNVTEQQRRGGAVPGGTQAVTGFHFRKGLPFSLEIEGHLNYLLNSTMFMVGADLRYSFLEGYKYVPNISVRGGVSRLLNATDIDMTTVNVEATLSKTFAAAGVMTITPLVGYGVLLVNANSTVLDATPTDPTDNRSIGSGGSLYTLPELPIISNIHQRFFAGLRVQTWVFAFQYQFDMGIISQGPFLFQHTLKVGLDF
jgi:hypothetical protein